MNTLEDVIKQLDSLKKDEFILVEPLIEGLSAEDKVEVSDLMEFGYYVFFGRNAKKEPIQVAMRLRNSVNALRVFEPVTLNFRITKASAKPWMSYLTGILSQSHVRG